MFAGNNNVKNQKQEAIVDNNITTKVATTTKHSAINTKGSRIGNILQENHADNSDSSDDEFGLKHDPDIQN